MRTRTFDGCLTCKRRKVRCLGGNPCKNCTRIGKKCISSFDKNWRNCAPTGAQPATISQPSASIIPLEFSAQCSTENLSTPPDSFLPLGAFELPTNSFAGGSETILADDVHIASDLAAYSSGPSWARSDGETANTYIQYYAQCSENIVTLEENAAFNHHRFIADFVAGSIESCPLRLAVLAWIGKQQGSPESADWYSRAEEGLAKLAALPDTRIPVTERAVISNAGDLLLSTSLYLTRYDALNRDSGSINTRLGKISQWLQRHPGDLEVSAFAHMILLWLCYRQIHINIFLLPTESTSMLLDELLSRSDHESIFLKAHVYRIELFGNAYPDEERDKEVERFPIVKDIHQTFILLSYVLRYRSLYNFPGPPESLETLQAEIERTIRQTELRRAAMPLGCLVNNLLSHSEKTNVTQIAIDWLGANAVFHGAKILWSRILFPNEKTGYASPAVASILQIAWQLRQLQDPLHNSLMQSWPLWPLPMFLAAIETTDSIHADWLRRQIEQVVTRADQTTRSLETNENSAGRRWQRPTLQREVDETTTLELMEKIHGYQNAGKRVSIEVVAEEMMRGLGGRLII